MTEQGMPISIDDRCAAIDAEERQLSLKRFDNDVAWQLGCTAHDLAVSGGLSVAIEICRGATTLFKSLLPGANQNNFEWTRRKIALVGQFERSSYTLSLTFSSRPGFFERCGLTLVSYVPAGGAVPIRVDGAGIVGVIAISGLPEERDHELALQALRNVLATQLEPAQQT